MSYLNVKINDELIDEIGEYLGFDMWRKRDKTKEYDFPNARGEEKYFQGDQFVEGNIIFYANTKLLVYKNVGYFHRFKALYTLNMKTLKPTKNSRIQKQLTHDLIEKLSNCKSL